MRDRRTFLLGCALALGAWRHALAQAAATTPKQLEERYYSMRPEEFLNLPEARTHLDFDRLNPVLLNAAVFHATNLERVKQRRRALSWSRHVEAAADLQARAMERYGVVAHTNTRERSKRTLADRMALAGLKPKYASEVLAMTFGRAYQAGKPFYASRDLSGRPTFSYTPNGPPMPMRSPSAFAKEVVRLWIESPSHRDSLLSDLAETLGCSNRAGRDHKGFELIYTAQVLYSPMRPADYVGTPARPPRQQAGDLTQGPDAGGG